MRPLSKDPARPDSYLGLGIDLGLDRPKSTCNNRLRPICSTKVVRNLLEI